MNAKKEELKHFINLLLDEKLSEPEIKTSMENLGLTYTDDEIERLNRVLLALHPYTQKNESLKEVHH